MVNKDLEGLLSKLCQDVFVHEPILLNNLYVLLFQL